MLSISCLHFVLVHELFQLNISLYRMLSNVLLLCLECLELGFFSTFMLGTRVFGLGNPAQPTLPFRPIDL